MRLKHYSHPHRTLLLRLDPPLHSVPPDGLAGGFAGAEPKIELFLSDLAVNGHVAASTQNQAFRLVEG